MSLCLLVSAWGGTSFPSTSGSSNRPITIIPSPSVKPTSTIAPTTILLTASTAGTTSGGGSCTGPTGPATMSFSSTKFGHRLNIRLLHLSVDRCGPFPRLSAAAANCSLHNFFFRKTQGPPSSNFRKSHEFVLGVLLLRLIPLVSCGRSDKVYLPQAYTELTIYRQVSTVHTSFRDAFFPRGRVHPFHYCILP